MQLVAMGAFIIKEQGDDVGGFRRTDQRHGVGVEGGQIVLQLAAAIDGRRNKVNLAGCHNTGQDQTDRGETYRWQTANDAPWDGCGNILDWRCGIVVELSRRFPDY